MKKIFFYIPLLICASFVFISCNKSDYLDTKPKSNLVIPTTLSDFSALLENDASLSGVFNYTPALGVNSTDDYYITDTYFQTISVLEKNTYTWNPDIYAGSGNQPNWNKPYEQILIANVVLGGMGKVTPAAVDLQAWNSTYGDALFKRAYAFWNLAQVFCAPYDSSSSKNDLGLPLKLSSDINEIVQRSSVQQTYDQILSDLTKAKSIVSSSFTGHLNRAAKPTVYAMLARVFMSMRAYNLAGLYADSCLQIYSTLIDYNTVSSSSNTPFGFNNLETIYQSNTVPTRLFIATSNAIPDSLLYKSYAPNDLRPSRFFGVNSSTGFPRFKYGYQPNTANYQFTGLSSSEMYLIRAECYARAGNAVAAMNDLNTLLLKRWKAGTYVLYTATSSSDALNQILVERRKETIFRGLRWMDIRRLNKEGYAITPKRVIAGQTYTIGPNSSLYVLPIPPDEIALSGIQQNQR